MSQIGEALGVGFICIALLFGCNDDLRKSLAARLSGNACVGQVVKP